MSSSTAELVVVVVVVVVVVSLVSLVFPFFVLLCVVVVGFFRSLFNLFFIPVIEAVESSRRLPLTTSEDADSLPVLTRSLREEESPLETAEDILDIVVDAIVAGGEGRASNGADAVRVSKDDEEKEVFWAGAGFVLSAK